MWEMESCVMIPGSSPAFLLLFTHNYYKVHYEFQYRLNIEYMTISISLIITVREIATESE